MPRPERIIKYLSDTHGIKTSTLQRSSISSSGRTRNLLAVSSSSSLPRLIRMLGICTSKRRRNLTIAELDLLAEQAGVSDLYDYAVSMFGPPRLRRSTSSCSIRFEANLAGRRKVILGLIPGDSTTERGLHFQLYGSRYAELRTCPLKGWKLLCLQIINLGSSSVVGQTGRASKGSSVPRRTSIESLNRSGQPTPSNQFRALMPFGTGARSRLVATPQRNRSVVDSAAASLEQGDRTRRSWLRPQAVKWQAVVRSVLSHPGMTAEDGAQLRSDGHVSSTHFLDLWSVDCFQCERPDR